MADDGHDEMASHEATHLRCRFYEQQFPEIDELVMVNVRAENCPCG